MKGFYNGEIGHHPPEDVFNKNGRRSIITRSRIAPLETEIYGELEGGGYFYEKREIEFYDEVFYKVIDRREMLSAIDEEISACVDYRRYDMAEALKAEKERIEKEDKK